MLLTKLPVGVIEFGDGHRAPALGIIACAVERISTERYHGNIEIQDLTQVGPTRIRLKIAPRLVSLPKRKAERAAYLAQTGYRPRSVSRNDMPGVNYGRTRLVKGCSWEVFRDVLAQIFEWLPSAHCRTTMITYRGRADFVARHQSTRGRSRVPGSLAL